MSPFVCRVCSGSRLELAIDLGRQPWANNFLTPDVVGSEPFYPLRVVHCQDCRTAQLDYTVPKEIMFSDHTYLSGVTHSLSSHFAYLADEVNSRMRRGGGKLRVLDIGSNDGTQLKHFQRLGYDVLGVESSRTTARIANEAGVPTVHAFFNHNLAKTLEPFDVITAAGVFFHLEELHSATEGVRDLLKDDSLFVVQFLYMKQIIRNLAFDQIYHEHLLYYNLATLDEVLRRHGLRLFDATPAKIHGGSMIAFINKKPATPRTEALKKLLAAEERDGSNTLAKYVAFASRLEDLKAQNLAWLEQRKQQGKRIHGLGAPVKGNTLLNYFGIDTRLLECLVERNPLRRGLVSPGMHIPVLLEEEVTTPPDAHYVLAWNFRDEILKRYRSQVEQGIEFYFPIEPRVDDDP